MHCASKCRFCRTESTALVPWGNHLRFQIVTPTFGYWRNFKQMRLRRSPGNPSKKQFGLRFSAFCLGDFPGRRIKTACGGPIWGSVKAWPAGGKASRLTNSSRPMTSPEEAAMRRQSCGRGKWMRSGSGADEILNCNGNGFFPSERQARCGGLRCRRHCKRLNRACNRWEIESRLQGVVRIVALQVLARFASPPVDGRWRTAPAPGAWRLLSCRKYSTDGASPSPR